MFRLSGLLCVVLAVGCGGLLFWTSQSVQRAERKLSQIEQSNSAEQETLRVLSAEWDYLNRPERLEKLTHYNIDMDKAYASEKNFIEAASEIPQPVVPAIPKIKPAYFKEVAVENKAQENASETPIIQLSDKDSFSHLIEIVASDSSENGGQP